jgi:hypothetical protein
MSRRQRVVRLLSCMRPSLLAVLVVAIGCDPDRVATERPNRRARVGAQSTTEPRGSMTRSDTTTAELVHTERGNPGRPQRTAAPKPSSPIPVSPIGPTTTATDHGSPVPQSDAPPIARRATESGGDVTLEAMIHRLLGRTPSRPQALQQLQRAIVSDGAVASATAALLSERLTPAAVAFLDEALSWQVVHAKSLPILLRLAQGPGAAPSRAIGMRALAQHAGARPVFYALEEVARSQTEPPSLRLAALRSLWSIQQFKFRATGLELRLHASLLKDLVERDQSEAVRAQATLLMLGVNDSRDVRGLLRVAELDRHSTVRLAALRAHPVRWRTLTDAENAQFRSVASKVEATCREVACPLCGKPLGVADCELCSQLR